MPFSVVRIQPRSILIAMLHGKLFCALKAERLCCVKFMKSEARLLEPTASSAESQNIFCFSSVQAKG